MMKSNVYSILKFAEILIKNGIQFSWRDFLDNQRVDEYIQKLVDKNCGCNTFIDAGIGRSCFKDKYSDSCVYKVNKIFYIDYYDEGSRDDFLSLKEMNNEAWEDGEWSINELNGICASTAHDMSQNSKEIRIYGDMLHGNSSLLDYVAKIYAFSSNKNVIIMERCDQEYDDSDQERYSYIYDIFLDAHEGNCKFTKNNKLVLVDYGSGFW